jgi:hypothetical protein
MLRRATRMPLIHLLAHPPLHLPRHSLSPLRRLYQGDGGRCTRSRLLSEVDLVRGGEKGCFV